MTFGDSVKAINMLDSVEYANAYFSILVMHHKSVAKSSDKR